MRELSLHILDAIENSIRAGASVISVTIEEDHARDFLKIGVEDDGCGLDVPPEVAANPFYTTKRGKRMGLGLSLFHAAAERAGGDLFLTKSDLGGLAVTATMRLSHIDRNPLGNLASTLAAVVLTNPQIELRCRFCVDGHERMVRVAEAARDGTLDESQCLEVAKHVSEEIEHAIVSLEVSP